MTKLLNRVQKLEALRTDTNGLVPVSEEWFNYWSDKMSQAMAGERVDLQGMTLEFIDALIAKSNEMENDEGNIQAASHS